jgi:xanthine/uracil permease
MTQIKSFGVLQTAKFAAILYFIFTAIFMIPFGLITLVAGRIGALPPGSSAAAAIYLF